MNAIMLTILLAILPFTLAQSTIQTIKVGQNGQKFEPDTLTAAVGSQVQFTFVAEGHSVSAAAYDSPCKPVNDSTFFSGDGEVGKSFTITINDTSPLWIYCPEESHCQGGMSAVINAPSTGQTLADFRAKASTVSSSSEPPAVQGGVQGDGTTTSASSTSAGSTSGSVTPTASAKSSAFAVRVPEILGAVGLLMGVLVGGWAI